MKSDMVCIQKTCNNKSLTYFRKTVSKLNLVGNKKKYFFVAGRLHMAYGKSSDILIFPKYYSQNNTHGYNIIIIKFTIEICIVIILNFYGLGIKSLTKELLRLII